MRSFCILTISFFLLKWHFYLVIINLMYSTNKISRPIMCFLQICCLMFFSLFSFHDFIPQQLSSMWNCSIFIQNTLFKNSLLKPGQDYPHLSNQYLCYFFLKISRTCCCFPTDSLYKQTRWIGNLLIGFKWSPFHQYNSHSNLQRSKFVILQNCISVLIVLDLF